MVLECHKNSYSSFARVGGVCHNFQHNDIRLIFCSTTSNFLHSIIRPSTWTRSHSWDLGNGSYTIGMQLELGRALRWRACTMRVWMKMFSDASGQHSWHIR